MSRLSSVCTGKGCELMHTYVQTHAIMQSCVPLQCADAASPHVYAHGVFVFVMSLRACIL